MSPRLMLTITLLNTLSDLKKGFCRKSVTEPIVGSNLSQKKTVLIKL